MTTKTDNIKLPISDEAAAHMYPSDLKKFEVGEHTATAFSIAVGCPDETSQPLFTLDQVRAAVVLDRQGRGEPVADLLRNGADWIFTRVKDAPLTESAGVRKLVERMRKAADGLQAPQPAEPTPAQERMLKLRADPSKAEALDKAKERIAKVLANRPEPVKVPSEEIIEAVKAYGLAYSTPNTTATELTIRLQDIRALLARYGSKS